MSSDQSASIRGRYAARAPSTRLYKLPPVNESRHHFASVRVGRVPSRPAVPGW